MSSDVLFSVFAIAICGVVFGLLITAGVLMVRDTIRQRGFWGVPFGTRGCRHCNTPTPIVRVPANARQFWLGGWTCSECGLELDKWGDPVPNQTGPAKWNTPLVDPRNKGKIDRPPDPRYTNPNNDVRPGGGARG